ncbi:uncharacterized protein yc1106_08273 [Curvularia clavata]|uniref:Biogenesis of lysosome-related organelles complex 1 subunit 1 n=1 Tax=Curvularia clavata TaxID=95742 RepID=A0A9Q8ZE46_CURCL|nr:uncharacterized protein yc1106_08273 [Curvularia clavata]
MTSTQPTVPSTAAPQALNMVPSSPSSEEAARRQAEARAAVTASLASVGASVDNEMRTRTADLHANAAAISKQEKELAKQTAALAKQSAEWDKLLQTGTKKLNEVGDIQNWAEMIERDLLVLEETVRLVDEERGEAANGTRRR